MNQEYHTIPCQHCGEPQVRIVSVKVATCFGCKTKIRLERDRSPENKKRRKESRRRQNSSQNGK